MTAPASPSLRTYLPIPESPEPFLRLRARDYGALAALPASAFGPYERAGWDRLIAISADLDVLGAHRLRALDVGCNSGLFTLGLAALGHEAVGVESNIAADVQGFYPGRILALAEQTRAATGVTGATFFDGDIETFLDSDARTFNLCLLLSVVHQWSAGYAETGVAGKAQDRVIRLLDRLTSRVSDLIYFEGPNVAPGAEALALPGWLLERGWARRCTLIGQSPAANGDLRPLFRLER